MTQSAPGHYTVGEAASLAAVSVRTLTPEEQLEIFGTDRLAGS